MKEINRLLLLFILLGLATGGNQAFAQAAAQKSKSVAPNAVQKSKANNTQTTSTSDRDLNIRAYIELLRSDIKSQATAIVAEVMQLENKEAETFWPIYREYELELSKQGDKKLALVLKYAENCDSMSNDLADQLAQGVLTLEKERHDLKQRYYERVKQSLSAITAARFLQVNNQLLMLMDLQIASALPVVK